MTWPSLVDPIPPLEAEIVDAACDEIRTVCGWHIAPAISETLTVDGPGGTVLILPTLWVTALTTITVEGAVLASTAYTWSRGAVVRRIDGGVWPTKQGSIAVALTHGYPACPPAVRREVQRVAAARSTIPAAITQSQVGAVSISYSPPTVDESVIAAYRLMV